MPGATPVTSFAFLEQRAARRRQGSSRVRKTQDAGEFCALEEPQACRKGSDQHPGPLHLLPKQNSQPGFARVSEYLCIYTRKRLTYCTG